MRKWEVDDLVELRGLMPSSTFSNGCNSVAPCNNKEIAFSVKGASIIGNLDDRSVEAAIGEETIK